MATHNPKPTSSWFKKFIGTGAKEADSGEEACEEFEIVAVIPSPETKKRRKKRGGEEEDWEIVTLGDRKGSASGKDKQSAMDSNQTDGFFGQGANKRRVSGSKGSPQTGRTSASGLKSSLKPDRNQVPDRERDHSPSPSSLRSTPSGRRKLIADPAQMSGTRSVSPGIGASDKKTTKKKKESIKSASPLPPTSPAAQDKDEAGMPSQYSFSKVRDTLRIRKGKKKKQINKVAQYSIPELNMPQKYQDPFELQATFTDDEDNGEGMGHEFDFVSIPHNKPQYCDHCGQTAWGHHQVLKCANCEFICHKKCEARIFIKCSSKTEAEALLQQDRTCEDLEESVEISNDDKGKLVNHTNSTSSTSLLDYSTQHSLPGSSGSLSGSGSTHVMSEKAILARKIREYNRKTTPVNHIHIKPRDAIIDYQGFVRVHMCIQRPIHVSTGVTRTSWYRLMRPVKERSIDSGIDAGLETAFYLPTDTNRLVHISNVTTTKELVIILLKKFCITDNPKKFSLYEEYGSDCRRLFDEHHPLTTILDSSVAGRNSKLVLRDNICSTIQWDAFSLPELNNFVLMLKREEDIYASRLCDHFKMWKKLIGDITEEEDGEALSLNGSTHPLSVSRQAPHISVEPVK